MQGGPSSEIEAYERLLCTHLEAMTHRLRLLHQHYRLRLHSEAPVLGDDVEAVHPVSHRVDK